jgi:hypothetical protein
MIISFNFDANIRQTSTLRLEKIKEEDLPLVRMLNLTDWSDTRMNEALLVKHGSWIVNADRTIVFKDAGGGSFEIPEMYDLFYSGLRVRLECGGAGLCPMWFDDMEKSARKMRILVTKLHAPPELTIVRDMLLALMAEAFAVRYMTLHTSSLLVQFRMLDSCMDWPKDGISSFNCEKW